MIYSSSSLSTLAGEAAMGDGATLREGWLWNSILSLVHLSRSFHSFPFDWLVWMWQSTFIAISTEMRQQQNTGGSDPAKSADLLGINVTFYIGCRAFRSHNFHGNERHSRKTEWGLVKELAVGGRQRGQWADRHFSITERDLIKPFISCRFCNSHRHIKM